MALNSGEDWASVFGGAGGGAASGAAIGSMVPGVGTAIGALGGGLIGGIGGFFRGKAKTAQKQSIGQARVQLEDLARKQREQRAMDMQKAMSYFGPVEDEMKRLYG